MPFWEGQESLTILQWAARAAVIFVWLLLVVKVTGQQEVGRLNLFDFVLSIVIGSVAAGPLAASTDNLAGPLTTIATLGLLHVAVAYGAVKHSKFRRIVQDEPLIIIQNGRIIDGMMRKARLNLDGLLHELRLKNVPNVHDVEFAILEPNGQLSVIPKSQARPLTPQDLQIPTKYEGLPVVVLEDGNILADNLRRNGLDEAWLKERLQEQGFDDPEEVFAAILDTQGRLYVSRKDQAYFH